MTGADARVATMPAQPASSDYGDQYGEAHCYHEASKDEAIASIEGERESTGPCQHATDIFE